MVMDDSLVETSTDWEQVELERLNNVLMAEVARRKERPVDRRVESAESIMIVTRQYLVEHIVTVKYQRGVWMMDSLLDQFNFTKKMAKVDTGEREGSSCLEYLNLNLSLSLSLVNGYK